MAGTHLLGGTFLADRHCIALVVHHVTVVAHCQIFIHERRLVFVYDASYYYIQFFFLYSSPSHVFFILSVCHTTALSDWGRGRKKERKGKEKNNNNSTNSSTNTAFKLSEAVRGTQRWPFKCYSGPAVNRLGAPFRTSIKPLSPVSYRY